FSGRIILQENRPDIPKVLNTLDCYYFPSITEGQPNALIEAMISGLPIVASDIDPIKECVPPFFIDELVPPLSVDHAVQKILDIYFQRHTNNLQQWAMIKFNHDVVFGQFFEVLEKR